MIKCCDIEIGSGFFNHQIHFLKAQGSRFAIITDDLVARLYGEDFHKSLLKENLDAHLFIFPTGEQYKTRETKEVLENQMFEKHLSRDTCVIALGGGVVTDLTGFVAATYCRGLPLIMIPTTLLGMVDACIGGKTGVNVPYGKNMVGSIYQPKKICIDPLFLKTLPKKELIQGVVEIIKHGLIADKALFEYLETHFEGILKGDSQILQITIAESIRIKKTIVEEDEKEIGKRRLLNFGHTVGHALEMLCNYTFSHGEAVAIGLLVESYLSVEMEYLSLKSFERIKNILLNYKLPCRLPKRFSMESILKAMVLDKKSLKGRPRFVVIRDIGFPLDFDGTYCTSIEDSLIIKSLEWMNDALCCN